MKPISSSREVSFRLKPVSRAREVRQFGAYIRGNSSVVDHLGFGHQRGNISSTLTLHAREVSFRVKPASRACEVSFRVKPVSSSREVSLG